MMSSSRSSKGSWILARRAGSWIWRPKNRGSRGGGQVVLRERGEPAGLGADAVLGVVEGDPDGVAGDEIDGVLRGVELFAGAAAGGEPEGLRADLDAQRGVVGVEFGPADVGAGAVLLGADVGSLHAVHRGRPSGKGLLSGV
jgi:hypothetical protein